MKYLHLDKPTYDSKTEVLSPDYKIEDGVFIAGWKVEPKPDNDPAAPPEDQSAEVPVLTERTASEMREQAYNVARVFAWSGAMLTVTEAAQKWQYYAAEGDAAKMDELTALIAAAKAAIREKYPDNAGGT